VREQDKRARRRRPDRHPEDDEPRKIAGSCFWARADGDMLVDTAVVVMSSRNVVAIVGKSRARQPGAGATARPVVASRVALDVL
jgi:hypothetical protein